MKQLTVNEVLEYAMKIEKESLDFYKNTRGIFKNDELKSLVTTLMKQEEDHLRSLEKLVNDSTTKDYFKALINIDSSKLKQIIRTVEISAKSTPLNILNIALEREKSTKKQYDLLLDLVKMSEELISTFEMLRDNEEEHIKIINKKIDALR